MRPLGCMGGTLSAQRPAPPPPTLAGRQGPVASVTFATLVVTPLLMTICNTKHCTDIKYTYKCSSVTNNTLLLVFKTQALEVPEFDLVSAPCSLCTAGLECERSNTRGRKHSERDELITVLIPISIQS